MTKKAVAEIMSEKVKKALLIGVNYQGSKQQTKLNGCINDVQRMKQCLMSVYGFSEEEIVLLTDTQDTGIQPSAFNIASVLLSLINSATRGGVLFVYFSGHGCRYKANTEDNNDTGFVEYIVAADGNYVTDYCFTELVKLLPRGCSITIVADCCHSGGLIQGATEQIGDSTRKSLSISRSGADFESDNLPEGVYTYVSDKGSTQPEEHVQISEMMRKLVVSIAGPSESQSLPNCGILLSACQSYQTAKEVSNGNPDDAYGVFTKAIVAILEETNGWVTNRELVKKARKMLKKEFFKQKPGLYCSNRNACRNFLL